MEKSSPKTLRPRGRPRLSSPQQEAWLRDMGWTQGFSRHAYTNGAHLFVALKQFITDARFAWLCSDTSPNGDPKDSRGHMRRTILTELGRIQEEDVREQLALHLCATKPRTREAVALLRTYRLGRPPHGSVQQLASILAHALQAYIAIHPTMPWEEVRQALARLHQAVELASTDE